MNLMAELLRFADREFYLWVVVYSSMSLLMNIQGLLEFGDDHLFLALLEHSSSSLGSASLVQADCE
jgi:hypothetical protein